MALVLAAAVAVGVTADVVGTEVIAAGAVGTGWEPIKCRLRLLRVKLWALQAESKIEAAAVNRIEGMIFFILK